MPLSKFADVDAQCALIKQLKKEDIVKLFEWQRDVPHLPSPLHLIESALFLHRCRFSIETAKQRIDEYYTFRSNCPEFFDKRDPNDPEMQRLLDKCLVIALPEPTPEGYLVIYARVLDPNPAVYDFNGLNKIMLMIIELMQKQRGCQAGVVGILDLHGFTVSHALKINIFSTQKSLYYLQQLMPMRFKSLHFVNSVPFMDMVMTLVQPFVRNEFPVKIHYDGNATIFDYVPEDLLPIECGGSRFCAIHYYQNVLRNELNSNADYFQLEARQRVDESKRPSKTTNIDSVMGIEGTYRQLNFD